MLTAYTARMAELLDPCCDALLVGDSLAQTIYGLPSTVPVTLDTMIAHGAAVARGARTALVVVDMPFGSYEASPEQAFASASRVLKETGAAAIKLEGGEAMAATVAFLSARGIPVMGHGPDAAGGEHPGRLRRARRGHAEQAKIAADAEAIAAAGAFAVVVEGVVEPLAASIAASLSCPVIGIGASASCDGQVLVVDDMLGMFERTARFVKRYDTLSERIQAAARTYSEEVKARRFPPRASVRSAQGLSRANAATCPIRHRHQARGHSNGNSACSSGAPAGSSCSSPGNSGEVRQARGACRTSSPRKRTENARRRRSPPTPPDACSVSIWKNTASPGSSSQPRMRQRERSASMSGRSARLPSGNHLAWLSRKVRGISQGPRCEPATNSSVASRATGSTGIHMLQFMRPSTL